MADQHAHMINDETEERKNGVRIVMSNSSSFNTSSTEPLLTEFAEFWKKPLIHSCIDLFFYRHQGDRAFLLFDDQGNFNESDAKSEPNNLVNVILILTSKRSFNKHAKKKSILVPLAMMQKQFLKGKPTILVPIMWHHDKKHGFQIKDCHKIVEWTESLDKQNSFVYMFSPSKKSIIKLL